MKINRLLTLFLLIFPALAQAQNTTEPAGLIEQFKLEIVLGLTVIVCLLALVVLLVALYTIHTLVSLKAEKEKPDIIRESLWQKLWSSANSFVPMEKEKDLLTDHEYDGIKELDNNLPPWWLWGFYVTIIFSVVYLLVFHVFKWAPLQDEEYAMDMKRAEEKVQLYLASQENLLDETNVVFLDGEADQTTGKNMYTANCVACHGSDGQGGVGPNLTDKYWIHGGGIKDIFRLIKYGNPSNGMISWQNQFTPKQMQQIASFIYTMEGTNPANPKAPQGELYERSVKVVSDSTAVTQDDEKVSLLH